MVQISQSVGFRWSKFHNRPVSSTPRVTTLMKFASKQIVIFAADAPNRAVNQAIILPLSPRVGCGAPRTLENRHRGPSRASGRPRRRGSKLQNVKFATDGFGFRAPLVNAVTVITPVSCANFGRLSFRYVDSASLLLLAPWRRSLASLATTPSGRRREK